MEDVSFEIFIPNEKQSKLTPNYFFGIALAIFIPFCWTSHKFLGDDSLIYQAITTIVVLLFVLAIGFMFFSAFSYEGLNGSIEGSITFKNDSIVENANVYELKDIDEIDIQTLDYYGKPIDYYKKLNLNPCLSQGVGNYIHFRFNGI